MCGISGILRWRPDAAGPRTERLSHRGPDGFARYRSPARHCEMALYRLALSRPDLPALIARDGPVVAASVGEIYNAADLGAKARDTDVVPALFLRHGARMVRRVQGPLAAAIFDERNATLTLVRDAIGQRPLFYRFVDGAVWFATEIKPLLRDDDPLCPDYITDVLHFGRSRRGPIAAITELPPGYALTVSATGARSLQQVDALDAFAPSTGSLGPHLDDAVEARVPAHRSCAVAVGGMDSLLIAETLRRGGHDAPAFTLQREADETATAQSYISGAHHLVPMPEPSWDGMRTALWYAETADSAASYHMAPAALALAQAVRAAGHHALFVGEGADEGYLGYAWHRPAPVPEVLMSGGKAHLLSEAERVTLGAMRAQARYEILAAPLALTHAGVLAALTGGAPLSLRDAAAHFGARVPEASTLGPRAGLQHDALRTDMHLLPVLHADRLYFAHGVETRAPFLDRRVVGHALGLTDADAGAPGAKEPVAQLFAARFGAPAPKKKGFASITRPTAATVQAHAAHIRDTVSVVDRHAFGDLMRTGQTELLWRVLLLESLASVLPLDAPPAPTPAATDTP